MAKPVPPKELLLENQICFSLYSTSRLIIQAYQPLLEPLGLTYLQYLTMLLLWERDDRTISEMGEALHLDSGTLSPLLKKLEQKKLLTRMRNPEDERSVRIQLTSEGRGLQKRAASIPNDLFCLTGSSMPDLLRLKVALDDLTAKLQSKF